MVASTVASAMRALLGLKRGATDPLRLRLVARQGSWFLLGNARALDASSSEASTLNRRMGRATRLPTEALAAEAEGVEEEAEVMASGGSSWPPK